MPLDADVLAFVAEGSPERVVVYDASLRPVYQNASAKRFLARFQLPEEIPNLTKRLFTAIALKKTGELFPGKICFAKEVGERRLVFRVAYREGETPLVCVYFTDETVSSHFDLNALRRQHRLTRREVDTLRHLLDGLDNTGISEELGIAGQTVKEYVSSIYDKLGVRDRFSLLRRLIGAS